MSELAIGNLSQNFSLHFNQAFIGWSKFIKSRLNNAKHVHARKCHAGFGRSQPGIIEIKPDRREGRLTVFL